MQNRPASVALLAVFLTCGVAVQSIEPCHFPYLYANTGYDFSEPDVSVSVACLQPGGCKTIIYAPAVCGGCFTPQCDSAERRVFRNVSQGSVKTVLGLTLDSGDLICSTGQVAAISRESTTSLSQAHEWPGSNLAGTKFVFLSQRGSATSCTLYAFENTTVYLYDEDGTSFTESINAFTAQTFGQFNAMAKLLRIISDKHILASCWNSVANDFVVLEPVSSNSIYGFSSQHFRGIQVDCVTLANTLHADNLPQCVNSNGESVNMSYVEGDSYFSLVRPSVPGYSGKGLKCSPAPGSCISAGTVSDGLGSEGTTFYSELEFGNFFTAPENITQVVLLSEKSSATCNIGNSHYEVSTEAQDARSEVYIKELGPWTQFVQGTTFNCSRPVYVVASLYEDEFNLFGLKPVSQFAYVHPSHSACSLTSSPSTKSPSNLPTVSPETRSPTSLQPTSYPSSSPSASPTAFVETAAPETDAFLVTGSSAVALAFLALIGALVAKYHGRGAALNEETSMQPELTLKDEADRNQRIGNYFAAAKRASVTLKLVTGATLRLLAKPSPGNVQEISGGSLEAAEETVGETIVAQSRRKRHNTVLDSIREGLSKSKRFKSGERKGSDEVIEDTDEVTEQNLLAFGLKGLNRKTSLFEVDANDFFK